MRESLVPIAQTSEVVNEIMGRVARGDVVSVVLKRGAKAAFFQQLGFPVVHGCVEAKAEGQRLMILNPDLPGEIPHETLIFGPDEVQWVAVMGAKDCVPIESRGRFQAGDEAIVGTEGGRLERVQIYGGISETLLDDSITTGREIVGEQEYFWPVGDFPEDVLP
jgi:hypothetical protein